MKTDSPSQRRSASVSFGAALTFESFEGDAAPVRVRPREDTLLRVIDGLVRLTVDGCERLLAAGEEAIIAAGARHRLASATGEAHVVMGFRAA
jgi:quercetin dioxygenase-like cupin family protein